jgi:hypothetical protein
MPKPDAMAMDQLLRDELHVRKGEIEE